MIKYPINNYGGVPEELRNGDWLPLLNSADIEQNPANGQPILTATGVAPGTYGDAFNVAQFTVDDKGRIHFAGNVPLAAASGTVSNFTFTDGDGFDGTVLTATTTPVLSLKTTLTQGSVVFISPTKGIAEENTLFFWDNTTKRLGIGNNAPTHTLHVTGGFLADVTAATMRFVGLATDNTATQVLAKNATGDNVWKDQTSIVAGVPYLQSTQIAFGSGGNQMTSSVSLTYYNGTVTVSPSLVSPAFRSESLMFQAITSGAVMYGLNVYYNAGNYYNYDIGAGGVLYFITNEAQLRMSPNLGSPGNSLSSSVGTFAQFKVNYTGAFGIGGNIPIAASNYTGAWISGDSSGNIKINTVAQDDTKTAVMVWDVTDKIVRWRNASSLITAPDTHAFLSAI